MTPVRLELATLGLREAWPTESHVLHIPFPCLCLRRCVSSRECERWIPLFWNTRNIMRVVRVSTNACHSLWVTWNFTELHGYRGFVRSRVFCWLEGMYFTAKFLKTLCLNFSLLQLHRWQKSTAKCSKGSSQEPHETGFAGRFRGRARGRGSFRYTYYFLIIADLLFYCDEPPRRTVTLIVTIPQLMFTRTLEAIPCSNPNIIHSWSFRLMACLSAYGDVFLFLLLIRSLVNFETRGKSMFLLTGMPFSPGQQISFFFWARAVKTINSPTVWDKSSSWSESD